jgi:hypothetical protein
MSVDVRAVWRVGASPGRTRSPHAKPSGHSGSVRDLGYQSVHPP